MKRFYYIAISVFALFFFACQSDSQRKLQSEVADASAHCPIKVADEIEIEKIDYADNILTYYTKVDDGVLQIKALKDESEMVKKLIYDAVAQSDVPEVRNQLKLCADAGAKIVFSFYSNLGDSYDVEIDPKDYQNEGSLN